MMHAWTDLFQTRDTAAYRIWKQRRGAKRPEIWHNERRLHGQNTWEGNTQRIRAELNNKVTTELTQQDTKIEDRFSLFFFDK